MMMPIVNIRKFLNGLRHRRPSMNRFIDSIIATRHAAPFAGESGEGLGDDQVKRFEPSLPDASSAGGIQIGILSHFALYLMAQLFTVEQHLA